jgi:hypothetical protein
VTAFFPTSPSPAASLVEQARQPASAPPAQAPRQAERKIRYTERSRVRVRGNATGRHYEFSGADPVQSVDARDAPALLSTRFFRVAH